jgi:hypothetical protein
MLLTVPDDYVPGHHVEPAPNQGRVGSGDRKSSRHTARPTSAPAARTSAQAAAPASSASTHVAGKAEEEKLKSVEKKLDEILDNPDINLR